MTNETLRAAEVYAWDRLLSGGIWKRRSVDDLREARAAVTAAIEARVRAESAAALQGALDRLDAQEASR